MRKFILTATALSFAAPAFAAETPSPSCTAGDDYTLAIHGGAGVILKKNMTDKKEAAYRKSLGKALNLGGQMLEEGYSALDTVCLLYTSPSPRDKRQSRMPSSA